LHFGSLIAACCSYYDAKSQQALWRLRIDDLDPPRVQPQAIDTILRQLDDFRFEWDGEVYYQSAHFELYQDRLDQLLKQQNAFYCECSRKALFQRSPFGIYDGHCKTLQLGFAANRSVRFDLNPCELFWHDGIQGPHKLTSTTELGDFILKRSDGIFGYHLACACDEMQMGITQVVRGADLLSSTFAQVRVMNAFKHIPPEYAHHPVALATQDKKFSKSANSPPIEAINAVPLLYKALVFLNQTPPKALNYARIDEVHQWAIAHWRRDRIPCEPSRQLSPPETNQFA
jgi:glutamyl-Q tRNA(Asp) synthetase